MARSPHSSGDCPLMTEQEVATRLQLSVKTLQRWRLQGSPIPYRKISAAVRYHPDDVESYLAATRRSSTSE